MFELYPLEFNPLLKEVVWGGRKLETLGKKLPPDTLVGESWEVSDLPGASVVVTNGPLRGRTLHDLLGEREAQILGVVPRIMDRFPILVKFIDAKERLSVQVHPNEEACLQLGAGSRPKSEGWYIMEAEPGACLYLGLKEGVDRRVLEKSLTEGTLEELLCKVPVQAGQFIPVPAGTVHAIGGGMLICEVQQMSDTTYRLWDWGRMDISGKPRYLQIMEALDAITYDAAPKPVCGNSHGDSKSSLVVEQGEKVTPKVSTTGKASATEGSKVANAAATATAGTMCHGISIPTYYGNLKMERFSMVFGEEAGAHGSKWVGKMVPTVPDHPVILVGLGGSALVQVPGNSVTSRLQAGKTILLPAACGQVEAWPESQKQGGTSSTPTTTTSPNTATSQAPASHVEFLAISLLQES